jgi:5-bromo-4-chloroindolyl phosphate hydrolysis protein
MKSFLLLLCLFATTACTTDPKFVYLCDSKGGRKYHLTDHCRGLSNCTHKIIKVTLDEAKKRGKTLCGWEK